MRSARKGQLTHISVPKPVGIWIRVSTDIQVQADSPEHHERRAQAYAESRGWDVVEVYRLEAVSGKSVKDHPEAKRMMKDVAEGRISGLIFSKLARLARNTRELLDFADFFKEHGADLVSLQEAIDTSTPAGRLFYTVIAAMAQWEREEIADRVAASVKVRAKLGKSLGGVAPFGYRWEGHTLLPDPKEAPVRKLMYELFLEHRRKKLIARLLNEAGYRTRKGAKFSDNTVDRLLRDPTAKGWRRANWTQSQGEGKAWTMKPPEEWEWTPVEPIVSEELWQQVNAVLDEQRNGNRRKVSRRTVHLFAGVTFCHCGTKMYVPSNNPKYICTRKGCRTKIPIEDVEAIFQEQLRTFFLSPVELVAYLAQADQTIKEKEELLSRLEADGRKVEKQMEKVSDAYQKDELPLKAYGRQYRPLEEQLGQIEAEIPRLQGEIDFLKIQYLSSDQILAEAQDLYNRWPELSFNEKRTIVENVVERITIGQDDIEIGLAYFPTSPEIMARRRHEGRGSSPRVAGSAWETGAGSAPVPGE